MERPCQQMRLQVLGVVLYQILAMSSRSISTFALLSIELTMLWRGTPLTFALTSIELTMLWRGTPSYWFCFIAGVRSTTLDLQSESSWSFMFLIRGLNGFDSISWALAVYFCLEYLMNYFKQRANAITTMADNTIGITRVFDFSSASGKSSTSLMTTIFGS